MESVQLRPSRPGHAGRTVPGRPHDPSCRRRHADGVRDPSVPAVPRGHRGGAADVAHRRPPSPGDRGAQLRALAHRMDRRAGRGPGHAHLRHVRLPGLRRHPAAAPARAPQVVRGGAEHPRAGAAGRRPACRHPVLLHLERTHVRQRRGVRELAAVLPAPGDRARRRRLTPVTMAGGAAVRRPRDGAARRGRMARRHADHLGERRGLGRAPRRWRRVAVLRRGFAARHRQQLGAVPAPEPLPERWAAHDDPIGMVRRLGRAARPGRGRPGVGTRRRHGAVGRVRQGEAGLGGLPDPGLLLRGPHAAALPRAGDDAGRGRDRPAFHDRRPLPTGRHDRRPNARQGKLRIAGGDQVTVSSPA